MKKPTTIPTRPVGPSGPTTGPAATTAPNKGIIRLRIYESHIVVFFFSSVVIQLLSSASFTKINFVAFPCFR